LHCAFAYPERVNSLVLTSYPASSKMRDWATRFADAIDQTGLDAAGAAFVWGERSRFDPKGAALIRQGFFEHAPHALSRILRELLGSLSALSELRSKLAELQIPVLIVAGANDAPSLEASEELATLIPQATLQVLPEAGHVVNLESPTRFNAVLSAFLEQNRTSSNR
jgi:pimeloyl-ACP methyl ester carboxylesterase